MKKFISGLLGILFVVLVVVGVFICTYVFNQPSRSGDSRELISGTWTDKDANITFEFSDEGDFTITHTDNKSVIAKGWFKIQEDGGSGKIQLLVNPSDRDTTVDIGLRMKFFSTISYKTFLYRLRTRATRSLPASSFSRTLTEFTHAREKTLTAHSTTANNEFSRATAERYV